MVRMTDEPEDYEGPWPKESAVNAEWVLVPREPTEAMLGRLWLELGDHPSKEHALDAYRAMLDAAPAAPQQAEPVNTLTRTAPAEIWLNFGDDADPSDEFASYYRADGVTWCQDCVSDTDVRYVRADLAHQPAAQAVCDSYATENQQLSDELRTDELAQYVVSLAAGHGPSSPVVKAALDWIVSELERKTNDERALAVKLDAIRAAPLQAEPTPTKRWWTDADELLLDSARDILIKSLIRVEGNEDAILRLMKAAPQQAEPVTVLPDGSAFFTASMPLPDDHWIFAPRGEWDNDRDCCAEIPLPILTHAQRDAVTAAIRYAVRGATDCGAAMDFDPDALVQNAVYALCGPFSKPKPQQLDVKSAVASTACPCLAFPDHVCNKCGRIHGYSHPPADEVQRLRDAAHNAIEAFDQGAHGADEIDALRRALEGK